MEKRKPSILLSTIKATFSDAGKLNRTVTATDGADDLDMDSEAVIAVIQNLTRADFEKSMTSHGNSKAWQDVYKPTVDGTKLYVKFTHDAQGDLLLISFKRNDENG